jgi:hypothetical protein
MIVIIVLLAVIAVGVLLCSEIGQEILGYALYGASRLLLGVFIVSIIGLVIGGILIYGFDKVVQVVFMVFSLLFVIALYKFMKKSGEEHSGD